MRYEGDLPLIRNLFTKKFLLETGDPSHEHIRPLLLVLSGAMRGVFGGGRAMALERFGLSQVFDTVIGVSTGAPIAAYFLASQSSLGTSIYYDECSGSKFVSFLRGKADTEYLSRVFRGEIGLKGLDEDAVRKSRSALYIGVTSARTGIGTLMPARDARPDVTELIRASISLPGVSGQPIRLGNDSFLDGGGAYPFPIWEALRRFSPTDVLVLTNAASAEKDTWARRTLATIVSRTYPARVQRAYQTRDARFARRVSRLRTQVLPCRIGMLWENPMGSFERRSQVLWRAMNESYQHMCAILSQASGLSLYD